VVAHQMDCTTGDPRAFREQLVWPFTSRASRFCQRIVAYSEPRLGYMSSGAERPRIALVGGIKNPRLGHRSSMIPQL
jgi:hypothetical protein